MRLLDFLRRTGSSLKFWSAPKQALTNSFRIEQVAARIARLTSPQPKEFARLHAVVKLAPIPLPRAVRWEGQVVYLLAWAGTAVLAWGAFEVPAQWLLWYGAVALAVFAGLFRMEGPLTRAERLAREAEVLRCHDAYQAADAHLKAVLNERFTECVEEFNTIRPVYEEVTQALSRLDVPADHASAQTRQVLASQVAQLEKRMMVLVNELEGFSDLHKEEIDAALSARHNAYLAWWQARLDESVFHGPAAAPGH